MFSMAIDFKHKKKLKFFKAKKKRGLKNTHKSPTILTKSVFKILNVSRVESHLFLGIALKRMTDSII